MNLIEVKVLLTPWLPQLDRVQEMLFLLAELSINHLQIFRFQVIIIKFIRINRIFILVTIILVFAKYVFANLIFLKTALVI